FYFAVTMFFTLLLFLTSVVFGSFAGNQFDPIINGTPAIIKKFPYYAVLSRDRRSISCGGGIIKSNIILTAAHCLDDANFYVYTGIESLNDLSRKEPYPVRTVFKHPRYNGRTNFDIGLVILSSHIKLDSTAQVIPIATSFPDIGSKVTIVGFGRVECDPLNVDDFGRCIGGYSGILRFATAKLTGQNNGVIKTVSYNEQNTCFGDSGGPVIHRNKVVGVVSSGQYSNCRGYDLQTSAVRYYRWLKRYMSIY
ncbi:Trypsin, partial [Oryctes borbonicus]